MPIFDPATQPGYVAHRRAYHQGWYQRNAEVVKARSAARYAANRDAILERNRKPRDQWKRQTQVRDFGVPKGPLYRRRFYLEVEVERQMRRRIRLLQFVSGQRRPACQRCGFADFRGLEVNHLNGGGAKETRSKGWDLFVEEILSGQRGTDDLNVLCATCNRLYEYERGRRRLPTDWEAVVEEEVTRADF